MSTDLTGMKWGRREVVAGKPARRPGWRRLRVLVECACGQQDWMECRQVREGIKTGGRGMCLGCAQGDLNPRRTHGQAATQSPEYRSWVGMHQRCVYAHAPERYAGVKLCERWQGEDGFLNFLKDMGPKPTKHRSIDREDNDGDYTPENCRWATPKQQARNRKNSATMTHAGNTKTVSEWADELGVKYATLRKRLKMGWTPGEAVRGVRNKPAPRGRHLVINGVEKTYREWAAEAGVSYPTFYARIHKLGWTPARAANKENPHD